MTSSVQVSLYPLGTEWINKSIQGVWEIFEHYDLTVEKGSMSTILTGADDELFAALQDAYRAASRSNQVVMVVTLSNACPNEKDTAPDHTTHTQAWKTNIIYRPIGVVQNEFDPSSSMDDMRSGKSRILLHPDLQTGLQGLSAGGQVMVLFAFHLTEGFDLLQHPRGDRERPVRGVFTLRSPRRPNPIGATVVDVLAIQDNVLTVHGLDAYHDTPVLDLKPA